MTTRTGLCPLSDMDNNVTLRGKLGVGVDKTWP